MARVIENSKELFANEAVVTVALANELSAWTEHVILLGSCGHWYSNVF